MFFRHHTDKLIYPIILLVIVILLSYRPKYRLRSDMPSAFFAGSVQKNDIQRRIAGAYWENAQTDIQWKYPYGQTLPVEPPEEFRIDARPLGPVAADAATRALYWHRLQQVWSSPEAWTQNSEWDWNWTTDPFTSVSEWLRDHADLWLRAHGPR